MLLDASLYLLAAYLVASLLVTAVTAFLNGYPHKQTVHSQPEDLSPRARALSFLSRDGVRLEAYYAPPLPGRPTLVWQAGKRATRDHMLPWARVLAACGYGVFTFDWRGQGESDGWIVHYGAHGEADLSGALAALAAQPEAAGSPVGIYACSLGGACVAMAGEALPDTVRCMVLDSPYGDLGRMAHDRLAYLGPLRWGPFWMLSSVAHLALGMAVHRIQPERRLEAFAPRPLFVMHGDQDTVVPYSEGVSLFENYPGPKEFWTNAGLDHVVARSEDTREWMRRIAEFFHRHLEGAPTAAEVLARTPARIDEPACWVTFRQALAEELGELEEGLERGLETLAGGETPAVES